MRLDERFYADFYLTQVVSHLHMAPVEGLTREFAAGGTPIEVCAPTIGALRRAGVRHVCLCNIPMRNASATVSAIRDRVG